MTQTMTCRAFSLVFTLLAALVAAVPVSAMPITSYTTTYNYAPISTPSATSDELVIQWSTALTSGTVTETDLVDLRFVLKNNGVTFFDDLAISGGVPQPVGGASRDITDIRFDFDLDAFGGDPTQGVGFIDNDAGPVLSTGTGLAFEIHAFGTPPGVNQIERLDGVFQGNQSTFNGPPISVSTQVTSTVPEPASIAIWSALGLSLAAMGYIRARRKK